MNTQWPNATLLAQLDEPLNHLNSIIFRILLYLDYRQNQR